jgi:hypothetical protein
VDQLIFIEILAAVKAVVLRKAFDEVDDFSFIEARSTDVVIFYERVVKNLSIWKTLLNYFN